MSRRRVETEEVIEKESKEQVVYILINVARLVDVKPPSVSLLTFLAPLTQTLFNSMTSHSLYVASLEFYRSRPLV